LLRLKARDISKKKEFKSSADNKCQHRRVKDSIIKGKIPVTAHLKRTNTRRNIENDSKRKERKKRLSLKGRQDILYKCVVRPKLLAEKKRRSMAKINLADQAPRPMPVGTQGFNHVAKTRE